MCHLLLMMPVLGVSVFWLWPLGVALPVYLAILFLSGLLYFAVFKSMHEPVRSGREGMLHQIGLVIAPLAPEGLVRLRGEIWQAISPERIPAGTSVEVVGLKGLKILVQRADKGCRPEKIQHCPL